jgi:protein tyrosine phosphatase (PTP) superfamily phosphohydrolase (DUF442 family)
MEVEEKEAAPEVEPSTVATTESTEDKPADTDAVSDDQQIVQNDLREEEEPEDEITEEEASQSPITYHRISVSDSLDTDLIDYFPEAIQFIEECLKKKDGGVLVHCREGLSRSPTIIISYLMSKLSMDLASAHQVCFQLEIRQTTTRVPHYDVITHLYSMYSRKTETYVSIKPSRDS